MKLEIIKNETSMRRAMNHKYELTDESIESCGQTLYRIRALRDFSDVKAGDLGGYVAAEDNLSQFGDCWVYDNACISDDAKMYGNASMYDNAKMYGDAKMYGNASMYDNAKMYGDAEMYDDASMYGNSRMYDDSIMYDKASMHDNAKMYDDSIMYDKASMHDNASMHGNANMHGKSRLGRNVKLLNASIKFGALIENSYIVISNINSEDGTLTIYRSNDGIFVSQDRFHGTLDEFRARVFQIHDGTKHYDGYMSAIDFCLKLLEGRHES